MTIPPARDAPIDSIADRIDEILPQTQCEQCGYHGCRPYAEAIAHGDAKSSKVVGRPAALRLNFPGFQGARF